MYCIGDGTSGEDTAVLRGASQNWAPTCISIWFLCVDLCVKIRIITGGRLLFRYPFCQLLASCHLTGNFEGCPGDAPPRFVDRVAPGDDSLQQRLVSSFGALHERALRESQTRDLLLEAALRRSFGLPRFIVVRFGLLWLV